MKAMRRIAHEIAVICNLSAVCTPTHASQRTHYVHVDICKQHGDRQSDKSRIGCRKRVFKVFGRT